MRRADQRAGGGDARSVKPLRNAEVSQHHLELAGCRLAKEDVAGLNVAVDHPSAMSIVEGVGHRPEDLAERGKAERPVAQKQIVQRLAAQQLHRDISHAVVFANIVDRHNIRVL